MYKLETEYIDFKTLVEDYKEAFFDFENLDIEKLEQKIIKKSLRSLDGVRIKEKKEILPIDILPEFLWSKKEIKLWEEKTGFTFNSKPSYFCNNPRDKMMKQERDLILDSSNETNKDEFVGAGLILDIVENMLDWAINNNRKIKGFMSTYNKFITNK